MTEGRDHWYHDLMAEAADCPPEPMDSEDLLYLLYTSGTTAKPKGIMHTTGGYLTQVAFTHKYVFDLHPETDVYWCAADIGWVTGHSYIVYGPLANGATSVMYEGTPDTPGKDRLWDIVERYGVTILYTAPTAIRTFMKWGAQEPASHDLSAAAAGLGRRAHQPRGLDVVPHHIGGGRCPIVDTWWQTETGAIMISPLPGATTLKPGSATFPLPGVAAEVVDDDGQAGRAGRRLPHAHPALAVDAARHLRRPERYRDTYWSPLRRPLLRRRRLQARRGRLPVAAGPGRRRHERVGPPHLDHRGRVGAGRPPGGGRVGRVRRQRPGDRPGHRRLRHRAGGIDAARRWARSCASHVATKIGPTARPKVIIFTDELPKTRSGKIMRRLLRDVAEGRGAGRHHHAGRSRRWSTRSASGRPRPQEERPDADRLTGGRRGRGPGSARRAADAAAIGTVWLRAALVGYEGIFPPERPSPDVGGAGRAIRQAIAARGYNTCVLVACTPAPTAGWWARSARRPDPDETSRAQCACTSTPATGAGGSAAACTTRRSATSSGGVPGRGSVGARGQRPGPGHVRALGVAGHARRQTDFPGVDEVCYLRCCDAPGPLPSWHDRDPRPLAVADGAVEPGPAVVFDMDGVLSDASRRQHFLEYPRATGTPSSTPAATTP